MYIYIFLIMFYSWDSAYEKELSAFKDVGEVGEIW